MKSGLPVEEMWITMAPQPSAQVMHSHPLFLHSSFHTEIRLFFWTMKVFCTNSHNLLLLLILEYTQPIYLRNGRVLTDQHREAYDMYLSIPTHDLAWLVHTASRPIPARSTLPAIQGCLIEALSDRVIFSGTNLDWGVKASLPARVSASGSLVVSAKILSDIVRTLPPGDVTLSLDESAWALIVKSGNLEMVLNAVPADDFPKWPEPAGGHEISLTARTFRELIKIGATCAVSNPARPLWGACLIDMLGDQLIMVSTDQFALSKSAAGMHTAEARAIVPANVLQDLARLNLKDTDEEEEQVGLELCDGYLYFTSNNVSCFTRLIEGQYYAYEQVIPKTFSCTATVSTEAMAGAASRASIVASEEDRAMRLILDSKSQTLTIRAGSAEKGKMEEALPARVEGEDIEIWVQHRYVLQALSKIDTEETRFGMTGQVSQMIIEPVQDDPLEGAVKSTFVIMPMSPKGAF
jgi:DNA polymerase-3 subunit beta